MSTVIGAGEAQEALAIRGRSLGYRSDSLTDPDEGQPTILIIDDDDAEQLALSSKFESDGFRIVFATSDEVRARLHYIQPDVILYNPVMQNMSSDQFCRWLKSHGSWRYVPVIAITRIENPVAIAAMLDAGADDVIVKPVSARELRARIAVALCTRDRYLNLANQALYNAGIRPKPGVPDTRKRGSVC